MFKFVVLFLVVTAFGVGSSSKRDFSKIVFNVLTEDGGYVEPPKPSKRPKISNRIAFGGDVALMNAASKDLYLHQVRLESEITNKPGYIGECGGSIVSSTRVITAAHCLKNAENTIGYTDLYFGITSLDDIYSDGVVSRRANLQNYVIHPSWKPAVNKYNDIAIIKLVNPVAEVPHSIKYISLPTDDDCKIDLEGTSVVISGWGLMEMNRETTELKSANTIIRPNSYCNSFNSFRATHNICAVGSNAENTCQGDSGGPMVYTTADSLQRLVGVTSFGASKCYVGTPSAFTRVCAFKEWINDNMGQR